MVVEYRGRGSPSQVAVTGSLTVRRHTHVEPVLLWYVILSTKYYVLPGITRK